MTRNTALRWLALLISLSAISIWSIASADLDRDWKLFAYILAGGGVQPADHSARADLHRHQTA